jgi:hypothetical protein
MGNSLVAERLAASQERVSSMELVVGDGGMCQHNVSYHLKAGGENDFGMPCESNRPERRDIPQHKSRSIDFFPIPLSANPNALA